MLKTVVLPAIITTSTWQRQRCTPQ